MDESIRASSRRVHNKRTRSTMASTRSISPRFPHVPHRSIYDTQYHNEHRASRRRLNPEANDRNTSQVPSHAGSERQERDGFDLRVPIMSAINEFESAIDLTDDTPVNAGRPPRLLREYTQVIEIASDDEDLIMESQPIDRPSLRRQRLRARRLQSQDAAASQAHNTRMNSLSSSPLFVPDDDSDIIMAAYSSRSRDQSVMPGAESQNIIDLTNDDDDLIMLHERTRPTGVNGLDPTLAGTAQHASVSGIGGIASMLASTRRLGSLVERRGHDSSRTLPLPRPNPAAGRSQPSSSSIFDYMGIPTVSNWIHHGFDHFQAAALQASMTGPATVVDANRPGPTQVYEAPADPADGFTRTPGEDEEVVCPNCGNELALGESEEKRQVWVIKACGHAYCGSCVINRLQNIGKKGQKTAAVLRTPGQPALLTKCVVEGCGKPVSKVTVTKVYMNAD